MVEQAIVEICTENSWHLLAVNVRTNHVHLVINGELDPDRAATACKARATQRLREHALADNGPTWARGQSTRHLLRDDDIRDAIKYVMEEQDIPRQ